MSRFDLEAHANDPQISGKIADSIREVLAENDRLWAVIDYVRRTCNKTESEVYLLMMIRDRVKQFDEAK